MRESWRYVGASIAGRAHQARSIPCQDVSRSLPMIDGNGHPVLALVAADGAGSASHSLVGAQIVCDTWLGRVEAFLRNDATSVSAIDESLLRDWVFDAAEAIRIQASATGLQSRDFACTLLAAVVGLDAAVFAQIGDGAIVRASDGGQWEPVFWPQAGEYVNTTFFVSDEGSHERLSVECRAGAIDEVAVFTDGLQTLALHYGTRTVHAPFFAGFFPTLRAAPAGESPVLNHLLGEFLTSDKVAQRSDDDMTLLLATRRAPAVEVVRERST